jgi:rod shape-determining protein MreD
MRSVATLLAALVLLLLQSMVLEFAPLHMVAPSFGLLVVLHVGFSSKWSSSAAALVAFATGYLFDLVSGAPRGTHAFVFVVMSIVCRLLSSRLSTRGFVLKAAIAFAATLLAGLLVVLVRALVSPEGGFAGLRQTPFEALVTALAGPPTLWLLERLDGRLDPARLRVGLARRRNRPLRSGIGSR